MCSTSPNPPGPPSLAASDPFGGRDRVGVTVTVVTPSLLVVLDPIVRCAGVRGGKVGGAAAGFSEMIRAALDKLDALQKCADNPTNPVLAGSCTNNAVALLISPRRVLSWSGPFAGRLGPCRTAAGSVRAPGQAAVARWSPRSSAAARSSIGGLGVLGGSATGGENGELGEQVVVDPGEVEA